MKFRSSKKNYTYIFETIKFGKMKINQLLLVTYCLGIYSIINGQEYALDKGATFISGIGSFTSSGGDLFEDGDNNKLIMLSLSPSFNHFITNNFFIGGGFELSNQKQGDFSTNSIGIGPQIGYAVGNSSSTVFPYFSAGLRYYTITADYGSLGDTNVSGTDIILGFGVLVPIRTHLGLAIEGGYHILDLKEKDSDSSASGNILSIGIGIAGLLF